MGEKSREHEIRANKILKEVYPKKYYNCHLKNQPDLQFFETNIGVEVTTLCNSNFIEASSILKHNAGATIKKRLRSKKGVDVGAGFIISSPMSKEMIVGLIYEVVIKKNNSFKNYKRFNANELFIVLDAVCSIDLSICRRIKTLIYNKNTDNNFDCVYMLDGLILYELRKTTNDIICYEIDKVNYEQSTEN